MQARRSMRQFDFDVKRGRSSAYYAKYCPECCFKNWNKHAYGANPYQQVKVIAGIRFGD
jgi:hypothetical protein